MANFVWSWMISRMSRFYWTLACILATFKVDLDKIYILLKLFFFLKIKKSDLRVLSQPTTPHRYIACKYHQHIMVPATWTPPLCFVSFLETKVQTPHIWGMGMRTRTRTWHSRQEGGTIMSKHFIKIIFKYIKNIVQSHFAVDMLGVLFMSHKQLVFLKKIFENADPNPHFRIEMLA